MLAHEDILRRLGELDGLYARDPQRFDALAKDLIDQVIADFPSDYRQRALGLQFVIDARLSRHKTPLGRMHEVMEMLWASFDQLVSVLNDPSAEREERERRPQGRVIPLSVSREKH